MLGRLSQIFGVINSTFFMQPASPVKMKKFDKCQRHEMFADALNFRRWGWGCLMVLLAKFVEEEELRVRHVLFPEVTRSDTYINQAAIFFIRQIITSCQQNIKGVCIKDGRRGGGRGCAYL